MLDDVYRYDGTSLFELELPRKDLKKAFGRKVRGLGFEGMNSSPYSVFGIDKDKAGNLWIGTIVAGAFRYDGTSFLWFPEKELTELPDGRVPGVRSMLEDKDGHMWLSNFVSKYKINEAGTTVNYEKLDGIDLSKGQFEKRLPYFNSGLSDQNGDLWMTTYTGGVWKYEEGELINFSVRDGETEALIISIYEDRQGVLWLGTDNVGVFKFNGTTFEKFEPIINESQKDTLPKLKFESMIRCFFEDSKGNFWIGSDEEGVSRFDALPAGRQGKTFTYFSTKDGLNDNQVRTIQEDQHGNIWLATARGVCKYDGETMTKQTAKYDLTPDNFSQNKWKNEANYLWFNGEEEGGIYKYDGEHLRLLKFPKLSPDHESFSITGTVTGISPGKNNRIWMANYGGVIGHDGESFIYINQRGVGYHVRSLLEDSKGNLWIGNNGIGVLKYDGKTTINFTEEMGVNDVNSIRGGIRSPKGTLNHVFAIAEDGDGNIWFGDRDSGAWKYNGTTMTNYTLEDGLENLFVRTIYADKKGEVWIGMEGGTVAKFNGKSFEKMF